MKCLKILSVFYASCLVSETDFASIHQPLQSAHQQFSLNLLHASFQENKNIHLCPFAIETALKIAALGSYKITLSDFKTTLKNPLDHQELIDHQGESHVNLATALDEGDYQHKFAFYLSHDLVVDPGYLTKVQKLGSLDLLQEDLKLSCGQKIQEWLTGRFKKETVQLHGLDFKETKGKIGVLSAVSYQLNWKFPFDPTLTSVDSFHHDHNESEGIVEMMEQILTTDYYEDKSVQAVSLPLENHLTCLIFLPKNDKLEKLSEQMRKPLYLKKIVAKMTPHHVHLKLPKIALQSPIQFKDALYKIGLSQPFTKIADFRLIDHKHAACLDFAMQLCNLKFNEVGINAEGGMKLKKNAPLKPDCTLTVNHPFLFLIMDHRNFTLIDAGYYQSPY